MRTASRRRFPPHGWIGLAMVAVFWTLNWSLPGPRTHWAFFFLWLGYCLTVDGLAVLRDNDSLATRNPLRYAGLFLVSLPVWWLFELVNMRLGNWQYVGAGQFSMAGYVFFTSLSFTTVVPAVFGTAELIAGLRPIQRLRKRTGGVRLTRRALAVTMGIGVAMFAAMLVWPRHGFPLLWVSLWLALDPINALTGRPSLLRWMARGDFRAAVSLGVAALLCGFFWELWNYWSNPKWVYHVPPFEFWYVFEMPLAGYLGYLPFGLELFAMYQLVMAVLGTDRTRAYPRLTESGEHGGRRPRVSCAGRFHSRELLSRNGRAVRLPRDPNSPRTGSTVLYRFGSAIPRCDVHRWVQM